MTDVEILLKAIDKAITNGWGGMVSTPHRTPDRILMEYPINEIIFNQTFAQTLWGKDWKGHLQQMVIDNDPVEYLGVHL
jgi:hypothetical protein